MGCLFKKIFFNEFYEKTVYGVKKHTDPFPATKDVLLQYKVKHEITNPYSETCRDETLGLNSHGTNVNTITHMTIIIPSHTHSAFSLFDGEKWITMYEKDYKAPVHGHTPTILHFGSLHPLNGGHES